VGEGGKTSTSHDTARNKILVPGVTEAHSSMWRWYCKFFSSHCSSPQELRVQRLNELQMSMPGGPQHGGGTAAWRLSR
jgi:hypothetical protein